MSCKDCGKKESRYGGTKVPAGPVPPPAVRAPLTGKGVSPEPPPVIPEYDHAQDPMSAMLAAKKMTYEELTGRRLFQQRMVKQQAEGILKEMTDDMRRVHVDELIGVANHDILSMPGMTPGQAIVVLQESLSRPEFAFIETVYPGLTLAVAERFNKLVKDNLPGPENQ